MTGTQEYK